MALQQMKEVAVFYPNRFGLQKVKVLGTSLLASNDHGAACHEIRHFVNLSAVLGFEGAQEIMDSMIECTPPITAITGHNMRNQRVVGMLKEPLHVKIKIKNGPDKGKQIQLILQNVVVVDKLPVPLHISVKQLSALTPDSDKEGLNSFMGALYSDGGSTRFDASAVSAEYRAHPFWIDDGSIFLGMTDQMTELNTHLKDTIRVDTSISQSVMTLCCALCGVSGPSLKKCSRCLKTFYCSKEHQVVDWKRHKNAECDS